MYAGLFSGALPIRASKHDISFKQRGGTTPARKADCHNRFHNPLSTGLIAPVDDSPCR